MRSDVLWGVFGVLATCGNVWAQPSHAPSTAPKKSAIEQAASETGQKFVKAFNAHDAAALSALWTKDAVYTSEGRLERIVGREKIENAYRALFKNDPKVTLAVRAHSMETTGPSSIVFDGIIDEKHTDGELTSSHIRATLVPVNGQWLFSTVHEMLVPQVTPPAVHLKRLQWFLGKWEEKDSNGRILTQVTPESGGNFLIRSYERESKDRPAVIGRQIIGWDQEQQCFRIWQFEEDGTFGEGYWIPGTDEGTWLIKLALKLPDGRRASLTQVVRPVSEEKLEVQNIDQSIDGMSIPNGPVVTLTRLAPSM